jgi:ribokinase
MKVLNFGSLNIDSVYSVQHFVRPGETISCDEYRQFCGGKGFNQSIALARAGAKVFHAGKIGADGKWLLDYLSGSGVDISKTVLSDRPTGHAIIQVVPGSENSIIIYGGANRTLDSVFVNEVLGVAQPGDCVLLQHEINCVPEILQRAAAKDLFVVFNPAPMSKEVCDYPLEGVRLLIVNELEGQALSGEVEPKRVVHSLRQRLPAADIVLTLGKQGAIFLNEEGVISVSAPKVEAVDSTGAGDTFIGFFLAEYAVGRSAQEALAIGCRAAALCVQRAGAADSIPLRKDVFGGENGE